MMMRTLAGMVSLVLAGFVGVTMTPQMAWAQTAPPSARQVGDKLAKARAEYEKEMQKLRDAVLTEEARVREGVKYMEKGPEQRRPGQRASKPSKPATPPPPREAGEVRPGDEWPQKLQDADAAKFVTIRKKMLEAYNEAIDAYDGLKNEELREAVAGERKRFDAAATADELPWDKNILFEGKGKATFTGSGNPQYYPLKHGGDYRFQLRGKWLGSKKGVLQFHAPVDGADAAVFEADHEDNGDVLVMFTVQGGVISPDHGAPRPIDVSRLSKGRERNLVIWIKEGTLELTLMTVKPLGAGGTAAEGDGGAGAKPRASAIRAGGPLSGTIVWSKGSPAKSVAEASVVSMTATELVVRHQLPETGTPVVWTFKRDGDLLWAKSFEAEGGRDTGGYRLKSARPIDEGMPGQKPTHGRISGNTIRWTCELIKPEPGRPEVFTRGNVVTVELTATE